MTPEEAAQQMRDAWKIQDLEVAHIVADGIMLDILRANGYEVAADLFDGIEKGYSWALTDE